MKKTQKIVLLITFIVLLIPIYKFSMSKPVKHWFLKLDKTAGNKFFTDRNTNLYILEKFWAMYGRKHGEFYTYSPNNIVYYDFMIIYLDYLYSENRLIGQYYPNINDYKIIHVCGNKDDLFTTCKDKMLKVIKEKTGYEFTEEELKNPDFDSIREYSYNI